MSWLHCCMHGDTMHVLGRRSFRCTCAAYDFFPCQFQLWYRAKGKGVMWYDPIFKVQTLDGREVWLRRHYRVRRAKVPGGFYFSVLDNGVVSKCARWFQLTEWIHCHLPQLVPLRSCTFFSCKGHHVQHPTILIY